MQGDPVLRGEVLDFYIQTAKKYGDLALSFHSKTKKELGAVIKEGFEDDPVSVVDTNVDEVAITDFKKEFDNKIILLTEESVSKFKYSKKDLISLKKPIEILDSLDGTVNFLNNRDNFCIISGEEKTQ